MAKFREFAGANGGETAADAKNVLHILNVSGYEIEPGVGVIAPANGDLLHFRAHTEREGEDFDIVHVTVNFLDGKNRLSQIMLEELESALRIGDAWQPDEGLHDEIKCPAAELPVERLWLLNGRFSASASTDYEIRIAA